MFSLTSRMPRAPPVELRAGVFSTASDTVLVPTVATVRVPLGRMEAEVELAVRLTSPDTPPGTVRYNGTSTCTALALAAAVIAASM